MNEEEEEGGGSNSGITTAFNLSNQANSIIMNIQNTADQLIQKTRSFVVDASSQEKGGGGGGGSGANNILKEVDTLCTTMSELQKQLLLEKQDVLGNTPIDTTSLGNIKTNILPSLSNTPSPSPSTPSSTITFNVKEISLPTTTASTIKPFVDIHINKGGYNNDPPISQRTTTTSINNNQQPISVNEVTSTNVQQSPGNTTGQWFCRHCSRTETKEWKPGPLGPNTLCYDCGLQYSLSLQKNNSPETQTRGSLSYILNPDEEKEQKNNNENG